jgi:hypothetical protein
MIVRKFCSKSKQPALSILYSSYSYSILTELTQYDLKYDYGYTGAVSCTEAVTRISYFQSRQMLWMPHLQILMFIVISSGATCCRDSRIPRSVYNTTGLYGERHESDLSYTMTFENFP